MVRKRERDGTKGGNEDEDELYRVTLTPVPSKKGGGDKTPNLRIELCAIRFYAMMKILIMLKSSISEKLKFQIYVQLLT